MDIDFSDCNASITYKGKPIMDIPVAELTLEENGVLYKLLDRISARQVAERVPIVGISDKEFESLPVG